MSACPRCSAQLETPLGCGSCGSLLTPTPSPTPFEVFGLEASFGVDLDVLKRRLLKLSRIVHPDYFAGADSATRSLAERNSAHLNEAYAVLADPAARADWLVLRLGGPKENERREMPKDFLLDVLEWNEALDAAREAGGGSRERAQLDQLERTLRAQREAVLATLATTLTPLPPRSSELLNEARARINALRYIERTLEQIAALRLDQATSQGTK